jgi:hypothetical protein
MTRDEFEALAGAWGADIGRWPKHLRPSAATFARALEGMAILSEAEQIDRLIIRARPEVSDERIGKAIFDVVTTLAANGRRTAIGPRLRVPRWLVPAASLACAAMLGTVVGIAKPLSALRGAPQPTLMTMLLDDGSLGPAWMFHDN